MSVLNLRWLAIFAAVLPTFTAAFAGSGKMRLEFGIAESAKGETQTEITRLDWLVSMLALQRKDGSLEEVIGHYDSGMRRNANLDPNLAKHPDTGLQLTAEERRARVAFLRTLTDESFTQTHPATTPLASRAKNSDAR